MLSQRSYEDMASGRPVAVVVVVAIGLTATIILTG